jgi:hypothetical protein
MIIKKDNMTRDDDVVGEEVNAVAALVIKGVTEKRQRVKWG